MFFSHVYNAGNNNINDSNAYTNFAVLEGKYESSGASSLQDPLLNFPAEGHVCDNSYSIDRIKSKSNATMSNTESITYGTYGINQY